MSDETCRVVDVSAAGFLQVAGADALSFLQVVCASPLGALSAVGGLAPSLVLNSEAEVIDIVYVLRIGEAEFLMLCTPGNREELFEWLVAHSQIADNEGLVFADLSVQDASEAMAALMLFGAGAESVWADLTAACGSTGFPYLACEFTEPMYGVAALPCYLFITSANLAAQVGDFLNPYLSLERLGTEEFCELLVEQGAYVKALADGAYFTPADAGLEGMLRQDANFIGARALRGADA